MKILFLCTANSCRSILSEAVFNHLAPPEHRAYSAGSHPGGVVHPRTLTALRAAGVPAAGLASKGLDAHTALDPDIVVTVCDQAAGDACPVFLGQALKVHWGLADPSHLKGSDAEIEAAFAATVNRIEQRTLAFLALPLDELNAGQLHLALKRIGTL